MANFTTLNLSTIPIPIAAVARWNASSSGSGGGKVMTAGPPTSWRNLDGTRGKGGKEQAVMVVAAAAAAEAEARMSGSGGGGGSAGKYKGTQMREKQLTEMIEKKVMEAKEVCGENEESDECKVAWDEVEEVSQAKADLRLKLEIMHQDPLESFCQENPETDECRIYED